MSYSKSQTMLAFAYMSYYGFDLIGPDKCNAQKIEKDIKHALTSWAPVKDEGELVWGPGVFIFDLALFDDNLMYLVRNIKDPSRYVIGIRGTNPVGLKDWLIEDFQVTCMVPWQYGKPAAKLKPKISKSTKIGITKLQEMIAEPGVPGEGKSLLEFLQGDIEGKDAVDICVTGHSLGGALAPTLALWLKDIQGEKLPESAKISTVAFAGPSAGNKDFATYSDQRFAEGECIRVANSLDVAPHAWNQKSLRKLFLLYKSDFLLPGPLVIGMISAMLALSWRKGYQQIEADAEPIQGRFKPLLYNYLAQGIYQHVVGYPEAMGMLDDNDIPVFELFAGQL